MTVVVDRLVRAIADLALQERIPTHQGAGGVATRLLDTRPATTLSAADPGA
jgi:hypothetical protein